MLVVIVLTVIDPFEFESATKQVSANLFYKIYSAGYPTKWRDHISVVMLDDDTLKLPAFSKESWPVSNEVHSKILEAILASRPKILFMDMLFFYKDQSFKDTADIVEKYYEHTKIFVLATSAHPTRQEILRLKESGRITLVSGEYEGKLGERPLYPLHPDIDQNEAAALALYREVCPHQQNLLTGEPCAAIQDDLSAEMEVVWGLKPAVLNCDRAARDSKMDEVRCRDVWSHVYSRPFQLLWNAMMPAIMQLDPFKFPYHAEISAADILYPSSEAAAKIQAALKDNIVLYGAHVSPVKDLVYSPVHGEINGVFLHAMALDNLLTYGPRYIYPGMYEMRLKKEWTEFQPAGLVAVVSLLVMWNRRRLLKTVNVAAGVDELREMDERFLKWTRRTLFLVVSVLGLLEFFVFRLSPFNWLGLIIVIHVWHRIERLFFGAVEHEARTI